MQKSNGLEILSLFDGISVTRQALKNIAAPVSGYTAFEVDKYAIRVAERNHPDIISMGDVTTLSKSDFEGIVSCFDLIIAGSPCQGFSLQGLQKGFEDPRSGLISYFFKAVEELPHKYFLLENVGMKPECQEYISERLGIEPLK